MVAEGSFLKVFLGEDGEAVDVALAAGDLADLAGGIGGVDGAGHAAFDLGAEEAEVAFDLEEVLSQFGIVIEDLFIFWVIVLVLLSGDELV